MIHDTNRYTASSSTPARGLRLVGLAALLAVAVGCATVMVDEPIGREPVQLTAERYDGTWLHPDGAVTIAVEDAEAGILRVAWIEGGASPALETVTFHLRHAGDGVLVSVPEPDAEQPRYLWGLLVDGDDQLMIFAPDVTRFRELVEQGELPGWIDGKNVALDTLEPEQLRRIVEHEWGFLFDLDEPLVLRRVAT